MKIGKQSRGVFAIMLVLFAAALVCAATKPKSTPNPKPKPTPIPKPGDIVGKRKVDCVWVCEYVSETRPAGYGVIGVYGQLASTPVSSDQKTQLTLVLTESTDLSISDVEKIPTRSGPPVAVPEATNLGSSGRDFSMDGHWSYRASNLRFLMRDGRVLRAGPDVTGSGRIHIAAGEPSVGRGIFADVAWEIQHWKKDGKPMVTLSIWTNVDAGGATAVTGKWHPLHLEKLRVELDNGKWASGKFRPLFLGGIATGRDDRTQPLETSYPSYAPMPPPTTAVLPLRPFAVDYAQWTFTRTCDNSKRLPPNIYVPPVADINNVPMYPYPTPTGSHTPNTAGQGESGWKHTIIEGILTGGGKSPR